MDVWRIARQPYCVDREGTGARLNGARWNSVGTPAMYAASSIALAAFEVLVHARKPPADLVLVRIQIPDRAPVESPALNDLPVGWRSPLPSTNCQQWGDHWCRSRAALALALPSVIIPEEPNYLINVAHPAMRDVKVIPIRPFQFDLRVL